MWITKGAERIRGRCLFEAWYLLEEMQHLCNYIASNKSFRFFLIYFEKLEKLPYRKQWPRTVALIVAVTRNIHCKDPGWSNPDYHFQDLELMRTSKKVWLKKKLLGNLSQNSRNFYFKSSINLFMFKLLFPDDRRLCPGPLNVWTISLLNAAFLTQKNRVCWR